MAASRFLLRLPAFAVNGITVAFGIGLVHLVFGGLGGAAVAQLAGSAAVCASLADLPGTLGRTWQRVLAAGVLAAGAALMVALLRPFPLALGVGLMALVWVSMMTMAWGPRAGPVSFAPILAVVFAMAVPAGEHSTSALFGWNVAGAFVYLAWSALTSMLLQRQFRRLALVAVLRAAASLLRSRAVVLQAAAAGGRDQVELTHWLADEAELAERLQAARDLLFAAPDAPKSRRGTAILLRAIDLRDVLLASRLDLDLLGTDTPSERMLGRVASSLRSFATALDALADALRDRARPGQEAQAMPESQRTLFDDLPLAADDPRARALPAIAGRLQHIADNVAAIHALVGGQEEELPLTRSQLQRFVGPEAWPLHAIRDHCTLDSPVLRHAVRMSLALGSAYFLAYALPWASHPHWLVLSVAVVLRGNLEQTLTRRNARVAGTIFGCLLVLLASRSGTFAFVEVVFLVAVGLAHSYVNVRYWVTATAATVMALLQSHLADPVAGFAIAERIADTVLGATLGWAFSYVLPSWERQSLPQTLRRALAALEGYARRVLTLEPGEVVEQRLARRTAYDALGAVAAAAQRSAVEPKRARLPLEEMSNFLDHGQRLMAHLSSLRLMLARRAEALRDPAAAAALQTAREEMAVVLGAPAGGARGQSDGAAASGRSAESVGIGRVDTLPEDPPATDPLPWLLRRLQLSVDDAHRARRAAAAALARL